VTFGANTRLTQIWNRVFSGSGIRTIDIPDSVEVINFDAFLNTTPNLTTISLLVGFRGDDPTAPRYGFTQAQWNSINWKFKRPFLGTILTQRDVKNIGWDMKTTITLADWAADAPNVIQLGDGTNGGAPFRTNNVLRSIEIPEKVSSIAFGSFFRATNLTSVTFQAGSQLKIIAQEAFRLTNLSSIILPTSVIEIGIQAFMDTSITTLAIPDGVTDIFRETFANTTQLETITFGPNSTLYNIHANVFNGSSIRSISIPNTVNVINANGFTNTIFLDDIEMPSHLKGVDPVTRKYGFTQTQWDNIKWRGGSFLGTILTQAAVISLGWDQKEIITLADWNVEAPNVNMISTNAQGAFDGNEILKNIVIPARITVINTNSFLNTINLESVTFEPGSNLQTIGLRSFFNTGLLNFTIPETVTLIDRVAFERSKITSLAIPAAVRTLGIYAFNSMPNLTSLTFAPNSQLINLPERFMHTTPLLTEIYIPNSVT
ncbi:MAG: leucine-rich repeat protein, partial [Metamycoplasmataceae bacterium]